jgi:hypothetical protein
MVRLVFQPRPKHFDRSADFLEQIAWVQSSRSKNRLTLSWPISMTSAKRLLVGECGSPNKKETYLAKVQRAVGGRLMTLINSQWLCRSIAESGK